MEQSQNLKFPEIHLGDYDSDQPHWSTMHVMYIVFISLSHILI